MNDLLMTFYGDDFTGSTDALEGLALNGVPTALFLEPPTPEQLQGRFANLRALGVAGISRSMSPEEMEGELRPRFAALKALDAPLTHYKVCSTFDSSPTVGSIGKAADIGSEVFHSPMVPLMVGVPSLKRYVAFGNLFATVGDTTYRIDRHPTMSRHPVTPMGESDLRIHLGKQTQRRIELIDLRQLAADDEAIEARFRALIEAGAEIILFDTMDESHLLKIGRLIWTLARETPLFAVGSSGVEHALSTYWQAAGIIEKHFLPGSAGRVEQIVVVSGSASPVSAEQIDHAIERGFCGIQLDSVGLVDPHMADQARVIAVIQALEALEQGQSVVLYS
ncbi:MAG: four-carbon acid sugar kinase family protein, partial [Anaerolineae bacterium]|nr:four-carbon acid sugar kinase family protein [Anaerolineae bacterium]